MVATMVAHWAGRKVDHWVASWAVVKVASMVGRLVAY